MFGNILAEILPPCFAMFGDILGKILQGPTPCFTIFRDILGEILQGPTPCFAMFGDILGENFAGPRALFRNVWRYFRGNFAGPLRHEDLEEGLRPGAERGGAHQDREQGAPDHQV
jgi:hypothetical protein